MPVLTEGALFPSRFSILFRDILELKMLNVNFMCPQNKCANIVPVGILPLLPPSENPSPSTSASAYSGSSTGYVYRRPKLCPSDSNLASKLSSHNKHFVGLLDDDLASMSSMSSLTPPPSSPSDHSPTSGTIPLIATDEEGQLIFQFSAGDDPMPVSIEMDKRRHDTDHPRDDTVLNKGHVSSSGAPSRTPPPTLKDPFAPPFPVPPTQPSQTSSTHSAALTLTPSFFALSPSPSAAASSSSSPTQFNPSSPFPFAPPVPTTAGLPSMTIPDSSISFTSETPVSHPNSTTPKRQSSTSDQSTPHGSPTITMPSQLFNRPGPHSNNPNYNPRPGPLAALQSQHLHQQHPRSPQLSGLPSPSLIPPSPLSLNPPNLDLSPTSSSGSFFPERKKPSVGAGVITGVTVAGLHTKRPSITGVSTGNGVARPTSPVVRPLKS